MRKPSKRKGLFDEWESLNELKEAGQDFVELRKDAFKLRMVESLSVLFNSLISIIMLVVFACVALTFVASALNWWLGELTGSQGIAALITGGFFIIIFVLLFVLRNKLFMNSMVSLFSKLLFTPKTEDEEDEEDE